MILVSIDPAGYPTASLAVLLTAGTAQISSRCFNVAFASQGKLANTFLKKK
jgi:hypothetical protein